MPQEVLSELSPVGVWLLSNGLRIAVILLIALIGYRLFYVLARRVKERVKQRYADDDISRDKRADTLFSVITSAGLAVVITAATLMILQQLDIEVGPLLASVGIVGLALGLGAQTLVGDVISGLFVLLEDQYRVGDVVEISGKIGVVEQMTLRVTMVRDLEGVLHYVPNGEIRVVSNRSRDWSRAIVDVGVPYDVEVGEALQVLEDIAGRLVDDPEVQALLLEEPAITGIEGLEEWRIRLRMMVKTLPGQQHDVQRYLRREIRRAFMEKGLSLAAPRQEIVFVNREEKGADSAGNQAAG